MGMNAERRIEELVDENSFEAISGKGKAGIITGRGRAGGRKIFVIAYDPEPNVEKPDPFGDIQVQLELLEFAARELCPVVLLVDIMGHQKANASAIPPDQSRLLAHERGVGHYYYLLGRLSGRMPLVSVLFSRIGAALSFPVAQCDFSVLMKDSGMAIGRPDAVTLMTGEKTSYENLAGAEMHCRISGTGDVLAEDEENAIKCVRRYLSYLPQNFKESLPICEAQPPYADGMPISEILPANQSMPFDIRELIKTFVDRGSFFELKSLYALEAVTGFARVQGRVLGIVANNSKFRGGALFPETCRKISRFISICDSYKVPMLFLADVPGFMVGSETEHNGSIKCGSLLFNTIANASVPRICVVIRKAYTAGLYAMAGSGFAPWQVLALPQASIAIYGKRTLEGFTKGRELNASEIKALNEMIKESEDPGILAEKNLIQGVIDISDLRLKTSLFLEKNKDFIQPDEGYPRAIPCI